ncbi:MAG: hypothetical protein U1F34_07230 [Gammaproteobacteria bacterium]
MDRSDIQSASLLMSDYLFVLAASNVGYIIFNFLNLNAGWIHRLIG